MAYNTQKKFLTNGVSTMKSNHVWQVISKYRNEQDNDWQMGYDMFFTSKIKARRHCLNYIRRDTNGTPKTIEVSKSLLMIRDEDRPNFYFSITNRGVY